MGNLIDMSVWNGPSLPELIAAVGQRHLTLLEIGSYRGQSAEAFLDTGAVDRIYCVDPWLSGYDVKDLSSPTDMTAVEKDFDGRMSRFGNRVVKAKGTIDDFAKTVFGGIDLVYIDGLHTYEGVRHDIAVCREFVKPAIAYSGHDYCGSWPGVVKAVDEALGKPDRTFHNGSWLKFVKADRRFSSLCSAARYNTRICNAAM